MPAGLTSSNYAITYANGTLAVIPAPIAVSSVSWGKLAVKVGVGKKAKTKSNTVVDVQFNGPVSGAGDVGAYELSSFTTKKVKKKVVTTMKPIRISSVVTASSPFTTSVMLVTATKPNLKLAYQLQVTTTDLTDQEGLALTGNNGQPGSSFVSSF